MTKLYLFDLDGTITASHPGITRSVRYALRKMNYPEVPLEELKPFIGPPLIPQFKEQCHMNEEQALQAVAFFRERYSAVGKFESSVYPGIPEMLRRLRDAGQKTGIASSKAEQFVREIVRHFQIDTCFDYIFGAAMDGSRVEKPDVIRFALEQSGYTGRPDRVIMVGDRKYDVEGAHAFGICAAGVTYGYGSREELVEAGADRICGTVRELEDFLLEAADEK